ncbi:MAG: M61 family peptidase, partial [Bacteroidetes bacterium]|nr:M61 family peptidase [Bacteroidota bacterium]
MHHELKIDVTFNDIRKDTLIIRMPNSSPGRYAEHNFVKNVYEEQAYNQQGEKIETIRISPYSWKIPVSDGFARFSYTLFGNHADGTYTGIDRKKLHMNMPATFIYGDDLEGIPVDLVINLSKKPEWTVA